MPILSVYCYFPFKSFAKENILALHSYEEIPENE